jgi:hypothetical protein
MVFISDSRNEYLNTTYRDIVLVTRGPPPNPTGISVGVVVRCCESLGFPHSERTFLMICICLRSWHRRPRSDAYDFITTNDRGLSCYCESRTALYLAVSALIHRGELVGTRSLMCDWSHIRTYCSDPFFPSVSPRDECLTPHSLFPSRITISEIQSVTEFLESQIRLDSG